MQPDTERKDSGTRITQAELARRLGVTRGAVSKAVKSGRITPDADGLFDPEQAEREWRANTRPNMRPSESPAARSKATGYAEARARKEQHAANILAMREAELAGRMMDMRLVVELAANLNAAWRNIIDHLPSHLARAGLGKQDLADMEATFRRVIDERMAGVPERMNRVVIQDKVIDLPPSPIERLLLDRMFDDVLKLISALRERFYLKIAEWAKQGFLDQMFGAEHERVSALLRRDYLEIAEWAKTEHGIKLPPWETIKSCFQSIPGGAV